MRPDPAARPVRITGQRPDEWSESTRATFDTTVTTGRSRPLHLPSVIAHHDAWIGPYIDWAKAVALDGRLPARTVALLTLRSAHNCRSEFEWGVHAERVVTAGSLTPEEIGRVGDGPDAAGWTDGDRALLQAADELHRTTTISDDTWAVLARDHEPAALVEITMTVGHYTMLAMMANVAGVAPEPYWAPLGRAPG